METLEYPATHEWHVSINKHSDTVERKKMRFMYKAKSMALEVPRMVKLFKLERDFGWGVDGLGNRHMTLDGRRVLFVVAAGECMFEAIDRYTATRNQPRITNGKDSSTTKGRATYKGS